MKAVTVKIREDGYITVEEDNGGIKSFKPITADSFLNCIAHSLSRGGITSGLLPKGCLSYTEFEDGGKRVCLAHQETHADVSYFNTVYQHFPLPRLVFGFMVNKDGRITGCDMGVAERTDLLKPATLMYRYPFSNVNGFRLCTGNNTLPKCESLHTLASLPYFILSMGNNNDHFKASNNKQNLEMRDLFELLKDKSPELYYSDILIPSKATLYDFINGRSMTH
jgi:hypothetical protein